jgi:hypothetical protein
MKYLVNRTDWLSGRATGVSGLNRGSRCRTHFDRECEFFKALDEALDELFAMVARKRASAEVGEVFVYKHHCDKRQ